MDVICKNGRHFHDLQAAERCAQHHSGGCGECEGIHWIPTPPTLPPIIPSPNEPDPQPEINTDKAENQCPSRTHRIELIFPCPRCCFCEKTPVMGYYLKTTTFYLCKYNKIVNWDLVRPSDIVESLESSI